MKFKRTCCAALAALMMLSGITVYATKASEIQSQKTQNEKALKEVHADLSDCKRAGTYTVPVTVTVPDGFSCPSDLTVDVKLVKAD